ncbi:hypothetical protein [Amycolatopsis vancoresmycina]|uniref:Uncharacterized protein n=1 Tax=Amycolatopsis vancoresmycina DSM 44592 TaxID=1292037 RepID=R1G620_9PSEU|nr:hypothetical protein [Amycolatopsis vancoresmycina]EOD66893.1 hypothetical protein H480_19258 [Amycolatopsis vancoresmycina DSM 44592]
MTLDLANDWRDRHPGTQHFGGLFAYGPELTAGLRKLVEAKDCFVRVAVAKAEDTKRAAELAEHGVEHLDLGGQP